MPFLIIGQLGHPVLNLVLAQMKNMEKCQENGRVLMGKMEENPALIYQETILPSNNQRYIIEQKFIYWVIFLAYIVNYCYQEFPTLLTTHGMFLEWQNSTKTFDNTFQVYLMRGFQKYARN